MAANARFSSTWPIVYIAAPKYLGYLTACREPSSAKTKMAAGARFSSTWSVVYIAAPKYLGYLTACQEPSSAKTKMAANAHFSYEWSVVYIPPGGANVVLTRGTSVGSYRTPSPGASSAAGWLLRLNRPWKCSTIVRPTSTLSFILSVHT